MPKEIDNPYVSYYSKFGMNRGWCVMFRYLINDHIKFSFVANAKDAKTAKKLARLCNEDWVKNNGKESTDEA